ASAEVLEAVRAAVGARGGRIELTADGSLTTAFLGAGAAVDLATSTARCALDLRAILPGTPMALVMGRGVVTGRPPVGEAIDQAARLLRASTSAGGAGVRLDEVTAGLLDARFDVRREGAAIELHGERDAQSAVRTLLGRPSACVGRERELGILGAVVE